MGTLRVSLRSASWRSERGRDGLLMSAVSPTSAGSERRLGRGFDAEHDQLCSSAVFHRNPACVEDHAPRADVRELAPHLEAVEAALSVQGPLQQISQPRNVPLPIAQLVDELSVGLAGLDSKQLVEGTIGPDHA